jgi:hypothetical protein
LASYKRQVGNVFWHGKRLSGQDRAAATGWLLAGKGDPVPASSAFVACAIFSIYKPSQQAVQFIPIGELNGTREAISPFCD